MQPIVVTGPEAEDVMKLLASTSAGLPRMLPELEPYRPSGSPP
jgi:poly-gamma-glutamate synthesis protein (capsule biosynthesis protein)